MSNRSNRANFALILHSRIRGSLFTRFRPFGLAISLVTGRVWLIAPERSISKPVSNFSRNRAIVVSNKVSNKLATNVSINSHSKKNLPFDRFQTLFPSNWLKWTRINQSQTWKSIIESTPRINFIDKEYIHIYISLRLDICSPDRNARARAFKKRHDIKFITGDERERKRKAGRSLNDAHPKATTQSISPRSEPRNTPTDK